MPKKVGDMINPEESLFFTRFKNISPDSMVSIKSDFSTNLMSIIQDMDSNQLIKFHNFLSILEVIMRDKYSDVGKNYLTLENIKAEVQSIFNKRVDVDYFAAQVLVLCTHRYRDSWSVGIGTEATTIAIIKTNMRKILTGKNVADSLILRNNDVKNMLDKILQNSAKNEITKTEIKQFLNGDENFLIKVVFPTKIGQEHFSNFLESMSPENIKKSTSCLIA